MQFKIKSNGIYFTAKITVGAHCFPLAYLTVPRTFRGSPFPVGSECRLGRLDMNMHLNTWSLSVSLFVHVPKLQVTVVLCLPFAKLPLLLLLLFLSIYLFFEELEGHTHSPTTPGLFHSVRPCHAASLVVSHAKHRALLSPALESHFFPFDTLDWKHISTCRKWPMHGPYLLL